MAGTILKAENITESGSCKRIFLWDNLKFLLITFVVVGHVLEYGCNQYSIFRSGFLFIYIFHMPLFIFISGLFYKDERIIPRVIYFLALGFILKFLVSITRASLGGGTPTFHLLSDSGIPWFLFSLAIFNLLAYVFRYTNKKFVLLFSIVLACFVGYDKTIGDFLYLSRTLVFFPFFWLGYMLSSTTILKYKSEQPVYKVTTAIVILSLALYFCIFHIDEIYGLRHLFTGRNPYSSSVVEYGMLVRLFCYAVTFSLCYALIMLTPNKSIPFITNWGKNSLGVYFWHQIFIRIFTHYCSVTIIAQSIGGKFFLIFFAVGLSIVLSASFFNYPMLQLKKTMQNR